MNPPIASVHGHAMERMFWITMAVIGLAFLLTQVLLFWYSYKYQHKEGRRAYFFAHNNKIEVIWTIIPAIVMAALIFAGWKAWNPHYRPRAQGCRRGRSNGQAVQLAGTLPRPRHEAGVVNYRLIDATNEFGFDLTDKAAQDDFTAGEIHVPKGHAVLLKIRSRDVTPRRVHAPLPRADVRRARHAYPLLVHAPTTTVEMRAKLGNPKINYELACNQICGKGHFAMKLNIVVDEPDDYQNWFAAQKSFTEQNPDLVAALKAKSEKVVSEAPVAEAAPAPLASMSH
jgi:cytochrome c oxidase subunit 2